MIKVSFEVAAVLYGPQYGEETSVIGFSDKVILKQAYSAMQTSQNNEILYEASLNITLCSERKNKGADQTAHMCRVVCAFVVHMQQNGVFLQGGPYDKYILFSGALHRLQPY